MKCFITGLCLLLSFAFSSASFAEVPQLINYQGRLLNGTNLVNGNIGLTLRLFNLPSGGSSIYEDSNSVTVADGLYSTFIGDDTVSGLLADALTNAAVWVEVAVNGSTLSPRERMASVPFALNVNAGGIAGTIADENLSANIARLNGTNQTFSGPVNFSSESSSFAGTFNGNGAGVTNVSVSLDSVNVPDDQPNVIAWGLNTFGQATASASATGAVAIAGGGAFSLALRIDGTVIGWGNNFNGQTDVPSSATGVVAIAAGGSHGLALLGDGTVIAWGFSLDGQTTVPSSATGVVAIAGGGAHSLSLRGDGTVIGWGNNSNGQTAVPAGATGVVAIAAGGNNSLALRGDGTVIEWGNNDYGQTDVPASATSVVAVSAGQYHSLALRDDGTVIGWGNNDYGQTDVPASVTGVVAIAAGGNNSLALRGDGTVIAWGDNSNGQTDVPASATGAVAIASGYAHSLALRSAFLLVPVQLARLDAVNNTFVGMVAAGSFAGNGSGLTGITGASLAGGTISYANLANDVLTDIAARANSNLVWNTFATAAALTDEQSARMGGDAALSNSVVSLATNISARAASNLVWSTFATAAALTGEQSARIGGDSALSNSVASLATNIAARAASNLVWSTFATAAALTAEQSARVGGDAALSNSVASRADSNLVWSTFATTVALTAEQSARIGGDAALSNIVVSLTTNVSVRADSNLVWNTFASLATNIDARLASNVWAAADATTNYTRRKGDTMTGALNLPAGGLTVGTSQLVVMASGNIGVGAASPSTMLHVKSRTGDAEISIESGDSGAHRWTMQSSATSSIENASFQIIDRTAGLSRFFISTNGNIGIGTSSPTSTLHVAGTITCTTLNQTSDRNAKENFVPVDANDVLEKISLMSFSQWNFKTEPGVQHIGPMAQDFHAAFGLGNNDTTIATVDEGGVALAAIQGLSKKLDAKDEEIEELQRQVGELRAMIHQLSTQGK